MVCRRGLLELLTCGSHLPGPMNLRAGSRGPEGQAPGWHCLFPPQRFRQDRLHCCHSIKSHGNNLITDER